MAREICGFDVFSDIADHLSRLGSTDLIEKICDAWRGLRPVLDSGSLHVYIDEAQVLHSKLPNCFKMRYEGGLRPMLTGVAHFFKQKLYSMTYLVFTG